jgi:cobalt-zinc-cadmium efflux system outer membrane protein
MFQRKFAAYLLIGGVLGLTATTGSGLMAQPLDSQNVIGTSAASDVEPKGVITLEAATELALSVSPNVSAAENELRAAEGALTQAGVFPNPEVSTSLEDTQNKATRTTTVQVSQLIELGGKRGARISAAERGLDVATADLAARRLDVRATVMSSFFDVLVAQERVAQSNDLLGLAQRAAQAASRRVIAGKISPVEETKARVAESSARIELRQAQTELVVARKRLAATWGSLTPSFEKAEGNTESLPKTLSSEEIQRRLDASPVLARARFEADRFAALANIEKARRIPNVTVSIGTKRAEDLGRNQTIVGLSVPFPLFDRNQGGYLEASRKADRAKDDFSVTEVRLNTEVYQYQERLKVLVEEALALKDSILPGARSAYEAASKGFELGKFSFLEVLDAQRTFFQARAQYLRGLSDAHRTAAELERVLGAPTPTSLSAERRP